MKFTLHIPSGISLCVLAILSVAAVNQASADQPWYDYYGMVELVDAPINGLWYPSRIDKQFQMLQELNVKSIRTMVWWCYLQPDGPYYNSGALAQLDYVINKAHAAGIEVLADIYGTPSWASQSPADNEYYAFPPADYNTWAAFLSDIVTRYRDRVHVWEIWNEQDLNGFFHIVGQSGQFDSVPAFTQLLQTGTTSIRAADPSAQVVICFSGVLDNAEEFLSRMITLGAAPYFDILSFHAYTSSASNSYTNALAFRQFANNNLGLSAKAYWVDEIGYHTVSGLAGYVPTETDAAAETAELCELMRPLIGKIFFYHLGKTGTSPEQFVNGMPAEFNRTLRFYAYRRLANSAYGNIYFSGVPVTLNGGSITTSPATYIIGSDARLVVGSAGSSSNSYVGFVSSAQLPTIAGYDWSVEAAFTPYVNQSIVTSFTLVNSLTIDQGADGTGIDDPTLAACIGGFELTTAGDGSRKISLFTKNLSGVKRYYDGSNWSLSQVYLPFEWNSTDNAAQSNVASISYSKANNKYTFAFSNGLGSETTAVLDSSVIQNGQGNTYIFIGDYWTAGCQPGFILHRLDSQILQHTIDADVNYDGIVDFKDFAVVTSQWLKTEQWY